MLVHTNVLAALFIAHFVGDFLLQNDWMALNKSKSLKALLIHVGVYSLCFFWMGLTFVLLTFLLHLFIDAVTSRMTSRLWFFRPYGDSNMWSYVEGRRHWFFVMIGYDQLLHALSLIWVLRFVS